MADKYQTFTQSGAGRFLVRRLGLPDPPVLRRFHPGQPVVAGPVLVGGKDGRLRPLINGILTDVEAAVHPEPADDVRYAALMMDATAITSTDGLRALYDFYHPVIRRLLPSGRVIVIGTPPDETGDADEHIAQRAIDGFVRSVGKEVRRGSTAQLVYVKPGAEANAESTLRFLLSAKSAYVSGQVIWIGEGMAPPNDWDSPLAGRVAVVTGAAHGIGAETAQVLARDGAHVVCLDRPADGEALARVAGDVRGTSLALDITSADAAGRLVDHLQERHGRVDIVVHNAGVTRDKTLGKMSEEQWDQTLEVNLEAPLRLTDALLKAQVLHDGGRVIGLSSMNGLAGALGQANYATSKAGIAGFVTAYARDLSDRGTTVNAVAPGFIDTRMTAAMPMVSREVARRMNSMSQAGLPVDVAETIAWLAQPASGGITGNIVRVCGQHLVGA